MQNQGWMSVKFSERSSGENLTEAPLKRVFSIADVSWKLLLRLFDSEEYTGDERRNRGGKGILYSV